MFQMKSAYKRFLEDIVECSKNPQFLFQIFHFKHLKNKKVLLKFNSHLDKERFLPVPTNSHFYYLNLWNSVLFWESIKKKIQKNWKAFFASENYLNLFFHIEKHQIYFTVYFVYHSYVQKLSVTIALSIEENRHEILWTVSSTACSNRASLQFEPAVVKTS